MSSKIKVLLPTTLHTLKTKLLSNPISDKIITYDKVCKITDYKDIVSNYTVEQRKNIKERLISNRTS